MLKSGIQARLRLSRIGITLLVLLIGSFTGEEVCRSDSLRTKWLTCDTSKVSLVFASKPADESRILNLVTRTDKAGTSHLFWLYRNSESQELWHAAWIKESDIDKANGQFTKLASTKLGDIEFSVTGNSKGLAIAWTDSLKGIWIREWNMGSLAWKQQFDGPVMDDEACSGFVGPPSFFSDSNTIFWRSFCSVPLDDESFRPADSKEMTEEEYSRISMKIMAAVHNTQEQLCYAKRNTRSEKGWTLPEVVLAEGKTLRAPNNGQMVFEDSRNRFSVFNETLHEGLVEDLPVLCRSTFDLEYKKTPLFKSYWPLLTRYSDYQVWAVAGVDEYFIVWDGPEEPEERLRTLFYSTTGTPWLPNILTPYRAWSGGLDTTVPYCVFQKRGNKGTCGLAAWASEMMPGAIAISRYRENRWSSLQIVMTRYFHANFAISLRSSTEGVLYVTTAREIRAIPFKVIWE